MGPIIRRRWLQPAGERRHDLAGVEEVRQEAQALGGARRCGGHRFEVRPRRWDERAGAVRQHEDEVEHPVAAHPAQDRQRLAFERVLRPHDRDRGWETLEVGSLSPCRLSASTTRRS
jgi:hypothetical protein